MTIFIECIYKFFENPNNLAEFEKWKEAKASKGKDINSNELHICNQNHRHFLDGRVSRFGRN